MRVTICPPSEQLHNGPAFDRHQFENRRARFNPEVGVDFSSLQHMHTRRVADLRKGRRLAVPAWANSEQGLRDTVLAYLEARFHIADKSGAAKTRLQRCREVAQRSAAAKKERLERWVTNFRAVANKNYHEADERIYARLFFTSLRGESPAKLLTQIEKQVTSLDGDTWMLEKAPEITLGVLYGYYRLNLDSPSIAESLRIRPPAVRQILYRASQRAVRKVNVGKRKPRVRLSEEKIQAIRRLHKEGIPATQIAAQFGIARDSVRGIVRGRDSHSATRKSRIKKEDRNGTTTTNHP